MGNERTSSPPPPDQSERWRSDPETVERRDREFSDRITDREPSGTQDLSRDDRDDNPLPEWRKSSQRPNGGDAEPAERKR